MKALSSPIKTSTRLNRISNPATLPINKKGKKMINIKNFPNFVLAGSFVTLSGFSYGATFVMEKNNTNFIDCACFWVGKWNQSKETMTWTYVDFTNAEIRGEIIETFSSNTTINVNVAMKDKKGNNLLRISSKANKI